MKKTAKRKLGPKDLEALKKGELEKVSGGYSFPTPFPVPLPNPFPPGIPHPFPFPFPGGGFPFPGGNPVGQ